MAESWPVGVPICIERGSLDIQPVESVLRSPVDIGRPMTRNRYTSQMYHVNWRMQFTKTELDLFYAWYFDTLNQVLTFDFADPHTAVVTEYGFRGTPKSTHLGGEQYIVSFNLESLP